MGTKSKFFRAFVEGQTISDGRTVTAEMVDEIVATFNIETYTPGINIEHISGFSPEPPFNRYGDVIAVRAQTDDITIAGNTEKRRALYAQIDAHDALVDLSAKGQKPFPSVELTPDYSGAQKIGLVNIAFTDNPASIATQKLSFSRSAAVYRTLYSSGTEAIAVEFEPAAPDSASISDAIAQGFAKLGAMFTSKEPEKPKEQPVKPANDNFDAARFAAEMGKLVVEQVAAAIKPNADALTALDARFSALEGKLQSTPENGFSRQPATGAAPDAQFATDC